MRPAPSPRAKPIRPTTLPSNRGGEGEARQGTIPVEIGTVPISTYQKARTLQSGGSVCPWRQSGAVHVPAQPIESCLWFSPLPPRTTAGRKLARHHLQFRGSLAQSDLLSAQGLHEDLLCWLWGVHSECLGPVLCLEIVLATLPQTGGLFLTPCDCSSDCSPIPMGAHDPFCYSPKPETAP